MSTAITIVGNLAKDPEIIAKENGFRLAKLTVMREQQRGLVQRLRSWLTIFNQV